MLASSFTLVWPTGCCISTIGKLTISRLTTINTAQWIDVGLNSEQTFPWPVQMRWDPLKWYSRFEKLHITENLYCRKICLYFPYTTVYFRAKAENSINLWANWEAWMTTEDKVSVPLLKHTEKVQLSGRHQTVDIGSLYCLEVFWVCTSTFHLTV